MPIVSSSIDLHFAMAFLGFYPFSVNYHWQSLVQNPLNRGKVGLSHIPDLVTNISLRRLKADCLVKLPPKAVETVFLELSDEERVKYDQKELDSKEVVQTYIRHGHALQNCLCPSTLKMYPKTQNCCRSCSGNYEKITLIVKLQLKP
ncbi:hypothetical protein C5167_031965 [Papaver somniferum]|uniref:SNF2 N-terminal domain-containing protein n=1 Tax=Papaver somniferum TaxID=3469 RepID=A0A4Y7K7A3_PAPSO|nr:putative SWI/SNF-related matrix-associated actin-dependent regulator of chromatin subfamily A member 3-like 1 [Papaver somniferum]XP_026400927.1 putative SWI/SNF-related matrix-associated actin-dependent regulator of chromatin subfamily A member 3-like 1 [Papaver somniferum]XP_026400928.1 putative SWI/SNF-related matrix-associated actin-dependent regulator of chromatin subfamily A member 3-like 1 [Papaver somniferum]XP_026400929.1 putative SWI/SNF-related matrix-associated actin-dependent reg